MLAAVLVLIQVVSDPEVKGREGLVLVRRREGNVGRVGTADSRIHRHSRQVSEQTEEEDHDRWNRDWTL